MKRTSPARARFAIAAILASLAGPLLAAAVSVFELHRPAAELIPVLSPLLGKDSTLVGDGNRLIFQGTPADRKLLESTLKALDRRPRNLLFEVRMVHNSVQESAASRATVTLGRDSGVELEARRSATRGRDANGFQVRALEGRPALVQLGQQRPVSRTTVVINGQNVSNSDTVHQNSRSGVLITARLNGARVSLDVAPQRQIPAAGGQRQSHALATSVSGRLGQWLVLGGIDTVSRSEASGTAGRQLRSGRDSVLTEIRVTLLD